LLVRQSQAGLEIQSKQNSRLRARIAKLFVKDVFRKARPLFLTIASGAHGIAVYVDGVQVKTAPRFQLSTAHFAGRLVVGDSPGQGDSWRGQLFGLAIYHRELTPAEVVRHYVAWTQEGRPKTAQDERNVALYLFDERVGNVVHNSAGPGLDLQIPGRYQVVDKIALEPFWQEFSFSRSYGSAALKNIVAFIPLGFCFYACLTAFQVKRAGLVTVILGTTVSVIIEVLQAYLPTRDSGTTDIFTNTLGTWIGVASYGVVVSILARTFPAVLCAESFSPAGMHHGNALRAKIDLMDIRHSAGITPARSVEMCPRTVYQIRPLQDPRWTELVDKHPRSSAFHTVAWLKALHLTYGFEPIACTTSPPGARLENGLVFCRVKSWITGRRMVSLPFSDHCEPLVDNAEDEHVLVSALEQTLHQEKMRYLEVRAARPLAAANSSCLSTQIFSFHQVDLRPDLHALFANCHKSCTQRMILRAEREGLICESGRSQALLDGFWDLLLVTRRRHGIPPQPNRWFRNLIDCFGEGLRICVAFKGKRPVAAILTLRHKDTLMYKYGCSDAGFHNLGGNQLLLWRSIQEAKREGLRVFDLGRTDCDNSGLITFKDRWGSTRSTLTNSRVSVLPLSGGAGRDGTEWPARIAKRVVPWLPDCLLRMAGNLLYRHIG
jgi:CelD/BcsL family acetyltransferase involved in cellulose biosynthesis